MILCKEFVEFWAFITQVEDLNPRGALSRIVWESFLSDPSLIMHHSSCTFVQFLKAIFYVGKGVRSRPLQHLVDAVKAKKCDGCASPVQVCFLCSCMIISCRHFGMLFIQITLVAHPYNLLWCILRR